GSCQLKGWDVGTSHVRLDEVTLGTRRQLHERILYRTFLKFSVCRRTIVLLFLLQHQSQVTIEEFRHRLNSTITLHDNTQCLDGCPNIPHITTTPTMLRGTS